VSRRGITRKSTGVHGYQGERNSRAQRLASKLRRSGPPPISLAKLERLLRRPGMTTHA
jgi:hypothetical protein